jgi:hypothetical protein
MYHTVNFLSLNLILHNDLKNSTNREFVQQTNKNRTDLLVHHLVTQTASGASSSALLASLMKV